MVALETAIELPNGHANGYRHTGASAEGIVLQDVESPITPPPLQKTGDEPISAAAQSVAKVSRQGQPATTTADQVKPSQTKAASQTRRKTGKAPAAKTTKQIKQAKSDQPKVRYVCQAELDAEQAKLEELSGAVLAGDTTALDKLRSELDNCPHLWQRLADLQVLIEVKLITLVAGKDLLRIEAYRKRCSQLRHALLDGEPSSLAVKMAASRVVSTWLFAQFLELRALESPLDLRCIKQLEQAERRYGAAMRTFHLAKHSELQVQRLAQQNTGMGV